MSSQRRLIVAGIFFLIILSAFFILSIQFGAKLYYFQESSFSAFKIMRDLEALRADKVESEAIKALINEKEADLDAKLMTVSSYQRSNLVWLGFLLKRDNDTVFFALNS